MLWSSIFRSNTKTSVYSPSLASVPYGVLTECTSVANVASRSCVPLPDSRIWLPVATFAPSSIHNFRSLILYGERGQ